MDLRLGNINLERLKLQNLYNVYLGMTPREQTMALIGTVIILILVVVLPVMVASGKITKLEKSIDRGNKQIKEIIREIDQLNEAKSQLSQVQSLLAGGFDASISTTLENLASQNGIQDRIDSLKEKPVSPS